MLIEIIGQVGGIIAVNKPAGLTTHSDEGDGPALDTASLVRQQLKLDYLGLHHRLDREVGGVLILAGQPEVNADLARSFESRRVEKEYLAIVRGRPPRRAGIIDAPLAPEADGKWRVARPGEKAAKPAITHYRVVQEGPAGSYSLLRLKLETGRTHQIRLHLAHLGCPIAGDKLYGRTADRPLLSGGLKPAPARPGNRPAARLKTAEPALDNFPRLLLHSLKITLPIKVDGKPVAFEAAPLSIFQRASEGRPLPELALADRRLESIAQLRPADRAGVAGLLDLADRRRQPLAENPSTDTTAYRLFNGEGDGLPSFTLDRYGPALLLNCYEPALHLNHPAIGLLCEEIEQRWPQASLYIKFRPGQLSKLNKAGGETGLEQIAPARPLFGPAIEETIIRENGLNYIIRPGEGFSPGLFLDMREMRARLAGWSAGRTVLNCFSYTGAFGLAARAAGAGRTVNLDASEKNREWAKANYRANGLEPDDYDFIVGDVFDWLGRWVRRRQTFDLVILDPPSYSTVKQRRWSAGQNYAELAGLAARVVAGEGTLLACTNHAGLSRRSFREMVLRGVAEAGRSADITATYDEPELDFPHTGEGYLKVLRLKFKN